MRYELVTPGTFDSITLDEARLQIKEPSNITAEDDLIKDFIAVADKTVESKTNLVIASSTWAGYLDLWPESDIITINKNNVSITSVQYYDTDNTLQTLATSNYSTDTIARPARIYLTATKSLKERVNAIKVNFTAGYDTQAEVDPRVKQVVRMLLTDWKENRTDYVTGRVVSVLPRSIDYLMNQLRIDEFAGPV